MSAAPESRARILIADDSEVCRTVLAILLKNAGYDVTSVVNGREALAKLREHTYDLAILDNDMPELDGLGTMKALRAFAPNLPVAVCSGTLSADLRSRYEQHTIEAIYDKPVDPRKLRDQIPAILERRRRAIKEGHTSASELSSAPFQALGESDAALEKPVFAGGSAQVRKLVADFGRIRDFRSAATISGKAGAAFLDVAVALAEERDAVLIACDAAKVGAAHVTKLFAPALLHTRPVLLIVLGAERLTSGQQDLLDDLLAGGGTLSAFNGRARVILCAQADLSALADLGEFSESLLMRAGAMRLTIPPLAQRQADAGQIARAVLRRVGAGAVRLSNEAVGWADQTSWPGEYMQLHRTIEIALRQRASGINEISVAALEAALAKEPTWTAPLYHDMLGSTLGGA